ncbi:MAG: hypothetical protein E6G92_05950 [Alphaproteobacteria bacterium]|nr:MAG: hypothetical protein E6G92_05950 [Alphaproteobacteria bacterium]
MLAGQANAADFSTRAPLEGMDLRALRPYVARVTEFLLILSAMLSAVTGAFSGVRAPDVRPHHAASMEAQAPCVEQVQRVARLQVPAASFAPRIRAIFLAPRFDLKAAVALYADRLIE